MAGRSCGLLLLLALGLTAQAPPLLVPQDSTLVAPTLQGRVHVVNPTPHARHVVAQTVLPVREGVYRGQGLLVAGRPAAVRPFGAPHADGSPRYLRLSFHAELAPWEEARWDVEEMAAGDEPERFDLHPRVAAGLGSLRLGLRVGKSMIEWQGLEPVEVTGLTWRARLRGRVPGTPVWAELLLEAGDESPYLRWWLVYGDSDPRDQHVVHDLPEVVLVVQGAKPIVWHGDSKSLAQVQRGVEGEPALHEVLLVDRHRWGDGQAQMVAGNLLLDGELSQEELDDGTAATLAAAAALPVQAVSPDWAASEQFGPWGLPASFPIPSPYDQIRAALLDYAKHPTRDPWQRAVHGCFPQAGATGDQPDFSAVKLSLEAHGYAARLYSVQRSVYQEACRPTTHREVDVRLWRHAEHPGALLWDSRPDARISTDLLGKEGGLGQGDLPANREGHRWWGHDRQHYSINYLTYYALLTGDPLAIAQCESLVQSWLGMMRISSPSPVLNGIGAPRAVGRTLQAGSMLYLVTGDLELRDRIRARLTRTADWWHGKDIPGPVRWLEVIGPDGRNLPVDQAQPWQEGLGLMGLDAACRVVGAPEGVQELCWTLGRTITRFGVAQLPDGSWTALKALAWREGGEEPPSLLDPEVALHYRPYLAWMAPGLLIAARDLEAQGDELAERARAAVQHAASDSPQRLAEWLAVR